MVAYFFVYRDYFTESAWTKVGNVKYTCYLMFSFKFHAKVAKMAKSPRAERADFFLVIWPKKKQKGAIFSLTLENFLSALEVRVGLGWVVDN